MKSEIQINNTAGVCQIDIEGTIGVPEEWQFEEPDARVATYERFRDTLRRIAEIEAPEVVVNIRSTGGDVNDALLIYDALAALDAEVTTRCYGYVASAATLIAQAASEGRREISAGALYLVHAAACAAEGNAAELEARAELLRKTDERLAALYARRSGRPQEEFAQRMAENNGNGRWLAPEEAVAAGLADKVVEAAAPADAAREEDRRNILHLDDADPAAGRSAIEAAEGQRRHRATQVLAAEDPSVGEIRRSANEAAYAADARQFKTGI